MPKELILDLDKDLLNSDWLVSRRILKKKQTNKTKLELAERELEELVEFDDLEEK